MLLTIQIDASTVDTSVVSTKTLFCLRKSVLRCVVNVRFHKLAL